MTRGRQLKEGVTFEVVWFDQDLVELQVRCSNGRFCGETLLYEAHDALQKIAQKLRGFPSNPRDHRTLELGTFDPTGANGGVRMNFLCVDSVGHSAVDVVIQREAKTTVDGHESANFRIPIEAAAIDSFVEQARAIDATSFGARATLVRR